MFPRSEGRATHSAHLGPPFVRYPGARGRRTGGNRRVFETALKRSREVGWRGLPGSGDRVVLWGVWGYGEADKNLT